MTLGGLALAVGILVDDATVAIENINRNLDEGKEIIQAILDGSGRRSLLLLWSRHFPSASSLCRCSSCPGSPSIFSCRSRRPSFLRCSRPTSCREHWFLRWLSTCLSPMTEEERREASQQVPQSCIREDPVEVRSRIRPVSRGHHSQRCWKRQLIRRRNLFR